MRGRICSVVPRGECQKSRAHRVLMSIYSTMLPWAGCGPSIPVNSNSANSRYAAARKVKSAYLRILHFAMLQLLDELLFLIASKTTSEDRAALILTCRQ